MLRSYMWAVGVVGVETVAALVPVRRPRVLAALGFMLGYLLNELPVVAAAWVLGWTLLAAIGGDLGSTSGLAVLGLAGLTMGGLAVVARRGLSAGPAMATALERDLPAAPSTAGHARPGIGRWPSRRSMVRVLLAPVPVRAAGTRRISNLRYGDAGRRNRLDLVRPREPTASAPVFIHFHGGHFRTGGTSRDARPLLHRLARDGWLCVSATYRLGRDGRFPNALVDAKQVVAWVRRHAAEYGADASTVVVAGSSAGAHLASMVALTPDQPTSQPGFEQEDVSVSAAVCLYGYYGPRDPDHALPSTPSAHVGPDAPPFLVVHGDNDTLVPPSSASAFVDVLRETSRNPVVHARLPGAHHSFDVVHSLRFEHVIDGIGQFLARTVTAHVTVDQGSGR